MSSLGNIRNLTQEACSSYMIYLNCSGVLDTHRAKLFLLKWPDAAITAISMVENPNENAVRSLEDDLSSLIIDPIKIIYESTLERVKEITKREPVGVIEPGMTAIKLCQTNPIKAKLLLIDAINQMFEVLETITGDKYPQIQ